MMFDMLLLTLLMSFTFTRLAHPLSMGLSLLLQTISVCLMSGLSTYSFWFSDILFLIFFSSNTGIIYLCSLLSFKWIVFILFYQTAILLFCHGHFFAALTLYWSFSSSYVFSLL